MRIGILTFWQTQDNYGQVLQGYALQSVLKGMGHSPYFIRYEFELVNSVPLPSPLYRRIAKLVLYPIYIHRKRKREKIKAERIERNNIRKLTEFRNKHFVFSECLYSNLKELQANPPVADCYIVGSDQVWYGSIDNIRWLPFYLPFGSDKIRRISYAVSFGNRDRECLPELKPLLKENLLRFDKISCREYSGVILCGELGIKASKVLDPTLIAPLKIYTSLFDIKETKKDFAYLYSINVNDSNEIRWNELRALIDEKGYKPVVTIASGYMAGKELYEDVVYPYSTVEQWLYNIYHAKIVVTTSFHGTVFCILFHKSFVSVPLGGKYSTGNNRIVDLLNDLGLGNRLLTEGRTYKEIFEKPIDWGGM